MPLENLLYISGVLIFVSIVFMHLTKKNSSIIYLYATQSLVLTLPLFAFAVIQRSLLLFSVAAITVIVKVIIAPRFFSRLIQKHDLVFSVSMYLSAPLSLVVIALFAMGANIPAVQPYFRLTGAHEHALSLMTAAMFVSLFLIINRKGALSQIVGVLSLENSITAAALLAGLEQSSGFQIGLLFEILIWIVIATIFISMLHKHFGSLDVATMRHLQE
jgi:hydrogenase-4 component E